MKKFLLVLTIIIYCTIPFSSSAFSVQVSLRDLVQIEGIRGNQLYGLGLVVGLNGTGDKMKLTPQMLNNLIAKFNINPGIALKTKNIASVMVTAELPPFARPGDRVDVTVSSIGDAKSLQGGILLQTPLKGADGNVYVVAQGPVSVGGFAFQTGGGGAGAQKNFPTVGKVIDGGIVENSVKTDFVLGGKIRLLLKNPDFTTAVNIANAINKKFNSLLADAVNPGEVNVNIPMKYRNLPVNFISIIENLKITPQVKAKIVVNERTGTIVIGEDVKISKVAIAHGNISVTIQSTPQVSQPPPLSGGTTQVTTEEALKVTEKKAHFVLLSEEATVKELVDALNDIGVTPQDVISILQAIKEAGALHAELEVM